ncbi:MAG: hypothetical protein CMM50_10385 [Rhodospirillaceae bacterium]|nr:hypothetical protein [Rhodospirillaceae bacterium]|tara:strand:- start:490 stop:1419 length:930 start_codon:yes stop_codon:yes gene_type:complete
MPYRLRHGETVATGIPRIVREQIDRALLDAAELERAEAVHQVRKRCKKIRAVLRLVRGPLEQDDLYTLENAWYRDTARRLSGVRDADAMIETFDKLVGPGDESPVFGSVRSGLIARRDRAADDAGDVTERLLAAASALREGALRVGSWRISEDFETIVPGLTKTYRRGRTAMEVAYDSPSTAQFHEWRKRVKYHWYHCRVLEGLWKPVMAGRVKALSDLSDRLGDDHDLGVLSETLTAAPQDFAEGGGLAAVLGMAERRRQELQADARIIGEKVYAEKAKAFSSRCRHYWEAWCREDEAQISPAAEAAE